MSSLYSLCSTACDRLIDGNLGDPSIPLTDDYPFFTEIDVVTLAGRMHHRKTGEAWNATDLNRAFRKAADVMGTKWRERKLYRYGPVRPPGVAEDDYARIGSKIVYSSIKDGPTQFVTPNGIFERFSIERDPLRRQGRRMGTNRSDSKPWSEQNIHVRPLRAASSDTRVVPRSTSPTVRVSTADMDKLRNRVIEEAAQSGPTEAVLLLLAWCDDLHLKMEDLNHRLSKVERREREAAQKTLQEAGAA